jgi:hypothetical protein
MVTKENLDFPVVTHEAKPAAHSAVPRKKL